MDEEAIQFLYEKMPGRRMPWITNGVVQWDQVKDTREWQFCEAIVGMIERRVAGVGGIS